MRNYILALLLLVGCIAAWGVGRYYFLGNMNDPSQTLGRSVKLVQAIVVVAALDRGVAAIADRDRSASVGAPEPRIGRTQGRTPADPGSSGSESRSS